MRGTIQKLRLGGGGGVIKPVDGDIAREREFDAGAWAPGGSVSAVPRMEVEYDPHPSDPRRAINVRPAGTSTEAASARREREKRRDSQRRAYRRVRPQGEIFHNPYNFVRPLPDFVPLADEPEALLLGRCELPPHDRAVGLSGRLACVVETCSATFVTDSHQVEKHADNEQHRTYRFHREVDRTGAEVPAIPSSTLRGVVRSAFEAATNSCWEHVAADRRLSRRVAVRGKDKLTPGRVERAQDGSWVLRVMRDACVPRYVPNPVPVPPGVVHGTPCRATVQDGWVRRIYAKDDSGAPSDSKEGWYFATGNNVQGKKNERFFHASGDVLPLEPRVVEAYVLLIADYRERNARQGVNDAARRGGARGGNRPPEDSRFLRPDAQVPRTAAECDGELVYARLSPDGRRQVQALSPVSIPRIMYERSLREVFPPMDAVRSCSEANGGEGPLRLCPACRVFGWVAADAGREKSSRAYRSRVRFGAAHFSDAALEARPHTLEILSAPKPTTIRFYLLPIDGNLDKRNDENSIDYDSGNAELRGRKFYRRRTAAALDVTREHTGQNRTLRDHVKPGSSATFEVVFQNLAPLELGALLWSLELEPGWAHRLGYGKPLGLGAVRFTVAEAAVFGPDRYEGGPASHPLTDTSRTALLQWFRKRMEAVHGGDFGDLANIADLRELLGPPEESPPVMYPRLPVEMAQESFEWFVENRSPRGGHWLDIAAGDAALPRDPARGTAPRERAI